MAIPICFALTAAEFFSCKRLPPFVGWLACHFSPSGPGLSNVPTTLPSGSVLLLDDSNPFCNHQPDVIAEQLENTVKSFQCRSVILDFQRSGIPELKNLTDLLCSALSCPVIATPEYAGDKMPVLLPPCPLNKRLSEHIKPFQGQEICLEMGMDGLQLHITKDGCTAESVPYSDHPIFLHKEELLHCHYHIIKGTDAITFHLQRTWEDWDHFLADAELCGIKCAIGLWQELKEKPPVR